MSAVEQRHHGAACKCTRCVGFQPQNRHAVRHGGYSLLDVRGRAEQLRKELHKLVPLSSPADCVVVELLALLLARIEHASRLLDVMQGKTLAALATDGRVATDERQHVDRLSQDVRGWIATAARYCEMLGLSPSSRLRLGLDLVRAERELSVVEQYREGAA